MKVVYICFIYVIYLFIVHWLGIKILNRISEFYCQYNHDDWFFSIWEMDLTSMFDLQNDVLTMRRACIIHKRFIIAQISLCAWKDYLRTDKDYLRLGKTI